MAAPPAPAFTPGLKAGVLARDYATRRQAGGAPLAASPVHTRWLAELAATYQAMVVLALRAAALVGMAEAPGGAGSGERDAAPVPPLARVVVPLAKLATARQGVAVTSQLLESFGGAGYLEDTGLPRLLRDVHVQCIWEGTTNVLALDVMRALGERAVADAFFDDVATQLRAHPHPATGDAAERVRRAAEALRRSLAEPDPAHARALAWGMARTYQAALLVAQAGWAATTHDDPRPAVAARVFTARPLLEPEMPAGPEELAALAADGTAPGE